MDLELVGLPYSPWSQRAKWAMHHHRVDHRWREYLPMLGELPLRIQTGKLFGRLSVPVLLRRGDAAILDSTEIARFAEEVGSGEPLFPKDLDASIQQWVERAERVLACGRQLVFENIAQSPDAQYEAAPEWAPRPVRKPMARMGVAYLKLKYRRMANVDEANERLKQALGELRDALAEHEGATVLAQPSFADLAMATALQCVRPVADEYVPLKPGTREAWTMPEVADEFADLLAWRDDLFDRRHYPGANS